MGKYGSPIARMAWTRTHSGNVENKWATFQDGAGYAFPAFAGAASRRQVALLSCSRSPCALRESNNSEPLQDLASNSRPCWTDFFEHSLQLMMAVSSWACTCYESERFGTPIQCIAPVERTCYKDIRGGSCDMSRKRMKKDL